MKVLIFYLGSIFLFISCNKSTKTDQNQKERNNAIDISSQITDIKTNLVFGKSWLYIVDSFLVVEEQKPIGDEGIHLFNKNTFKYITGTGTVGKGPRELTRQGRISLLKLMPVENMAMISEFSASLEVKNITAMNTNKGLKRLAK